MRGVDHLARPAPGILIAHSAALPDVRVGRKALVNLPLAELEPVTQHESEDLGGRTSRVAGEPFQAALLRGA